MLDVVPELNPERHHPPGVRNPSKTFPQEPETNQHYQGVAIMQGFRLDQPRVPQTKQTVGHWTRPSHHINLIGLKKVLCPVTEHDQHEYLKRAFVPLGVE